MSIPIEDNDQTRARREHLAELRALVGNVYPNRFERSRVTKNASGEDTITALVAEFGRYAPQLKEGERPAPEELERANAELSGVEVRISGRIATPPRVMGKAAFVHLSDGVSRLQIYVRRADVRAVNNTTGALIEDEGAGWRLFGLLDHGDFIGVAGYLFLTKTGELSVHVRELQFLAKALLPMPDKLHGISDPEIRQRQRYADLIAGSLKVQEKTGEGEGAATGARELSTREVFERRSKVITELRRFLDQHGYVEVETPMLTPKATGAAARPFKTHHNALDIDLYARIAPELYLKRLLVGGFERVYELNRNFRNEGIGYRWNPEFTMLEFYCAYMDVNGMMDFCEQMLHTTIEHAIGATRISFGEQEIDFGSKFERLTMKEAIVKYWPDDFATVGQEKIEIRLLDDITGVRFLKSLVRLMEMEITETVTSKDETVERTGHHNPQEAWRIAKNMSSTPPPIINESKESWMARSIAKIFEIVAEPRLIQPTFITDFPKPISPLSKGSPADPTIAERFELFIAGMECANGFSELNDPVEQFERFAEQAEQRERGDEEAMVLDEDYIRALSYGMPPAAGIGIGIDRLVMILTGKRSIRDVILFPHMRPERKAEETAADEQAGEESA